MPQVSRPAQMSNPDLSHTASILSPPISHSDCIALRIAIFMAAIGICRECLGYPLRGVSRLLYANRFRCYVRSLVARYHDVG